MNYLREQFIISVLVSLSLSYCASQALPSTSGIGFEEKSPLSFSDLEQSYATLSRTAVARDALFANVMHGKNEFISTDNGRNFNIPINENIRNKPIGTFQYSDSNGDLHIVNYINDHSGLRILNDYKPFERIKATKDFENAQSYNTRNNEINKFHNEIPNQANRDPSNSDEENIDWDEVEFRFIPEVKNKNKDENENKYDLNASESFEKPKKLIENKPISSINQNMSLILPQVMNSMPLPQPFSGLQNTGEVPFFWQRPDENAANWGGQPYPPHQAQSVSYGMPLRDSTANLGPQPFPHFFNWNYDMNTRQ